ncbi:MAG: hypothetical protein HYV27_19955 [Candidatus Hydrogenedentes bacterium]|nr:hypothetical protein [Candidatus Hydrogenedentota bacterium]
MNTTALNQRQSGILRELTGIRFMKKGSVTFQCFKPKDSDGASAVRGPYPVLTWKEQGRTKSMRLRSSEDVAWAQEAIENYRRFTALCREFEELAERLALHQRDAGTAAAAEAGKKGLKPRKKPKQDAL